MCVGFFYPILELATPSFTTMGGGKHLIHMYLFFSSFFYFPEKIDWSLKSSVPSNTTTTSSSSSSLTTGPGKLQPDRFFPFIGCNGFSSSFQSQSSVPSIPANQFGRPSPFLSSNFPTSFQSNFNGKNESTFTCQFPCDDNQFSKDKVTAAKNNISNGNNSVLLLPNRSSYVTEGVNCNVGSHLLGDFSSEFSKLTVVKNKNL